MRIRVSFLLIPLLCKLTCIVNILLYNYRSPFINSSLRGSCLNQFSLLNLYDCMFCLMTGYGNKNYVMSCHVMWLMSCHAMLCFQQTKPRFYSLHFTFLQPLTETRSTFRLMGGDLDGRLQRLLRASTCFRLRILTTTWLATRGPISSKSSTN